MASLELQKLWKLAQVDNGLVDIRKRAAALDVGQSLQPKLAELEREFAEHVAPAKALQTEALDIELRQKSIDEKIAKFDKQLYGGAVVNAREVENIEKEIQMLKKQRAALDDRLLEIWDKAPAMQKVADVVETRLNEVKKAIADKRKAAIAEKARLEADFKRYTEARPGLTGGISASLMSKYDDIRKRVGGSGMVEVTRRQTCAGCGLVIPEQTMAHLADDKVVTCEGCRRILYYTTGVV